MKASGGLGSATGAAAETENIQNAQERDYRRLGQLPTTVPTLAAGTRSAREVFVDVGGDSEGPVRGISVPERILATAVKFTEELGRMFGGDVSTTSDITSFGEGFVSHRIPPVRPDTMTGDTIDTAALKDPGPKGDVTAVGGMLACAVGRPTALVDEGDVRPPTEGDGGKRPETATMTAFTKCRDATEL